MKHVITSILFCRQYVNLDTKLYEVTGLKNLSPQIIRIYLNHQAPAFIFVKKKSNALTSLSQVHYFKCKRMNIIYKRGEAGLSEEKHLLIEAEYFDL